MKKILLHTIASEKIGGTTTVIKEIQTSYLNEKFNFVNLYQTEACGFNPIKAIRFVLKYKRLIDKEHADAIYICGLLYSGFLITLAAKLSNVKRVIVSVHGSEWDRPNSKLLNRFILCKILEPITVRLADSVFTVCKKALENPAVMIKKSATVIYNRIPQIDYKTIETGMIRAELGIEQNKLVVTVVGRVVEGKGHRYIIDAIKKMADPRFVFLIVGDGPYTDIYEKECKTEISNGSVKLLGVRGDVYKILKDSDIFLFATLHENHSKSLLEAVCMRCAALCTNVGGNPEIIDDGVSGILMPPKDSDAIVRGLLKLADSKLRSFYSNNALRINSEKYSDVNTLGKLETLFAHD